MLRPNDPSVSAAEQAERPARCPVCRSADITTTGKVVTAESYWRCCACGEVWNAGRQRAAGRHAPNYWR